MENPEGVVTEESDAEADTEKEEADDRISGHCRHSNKQADDQVGW